jgi:hypothetical protein
MSQLSREIGHLDHAAAAAAWLRHMRAGEFERAWRVSDGVLQTRAGAACGDRPRHEQYVWDGSPIDGRRVFVRCYHGLGDTIQFVRYAALLRRRAAHVTFWAQPRLLPLLDGVEGIDRLLPLHDGDPGVDRDVEVEIMELPHVFRTTLETIPSDVPYLHVAPAALPRAGRPRVGLVWRAGDWLPHRSVPFPSLSPLLSLPVSWYILQSEPGLSECPTGAGIAAGTHDLVELASVMRALDLVITVDSMTAHLAGALAVPVWTLLAADADWRWMERRADSPWYPTMTLFRQKQAGDWAPVVARAAAELRTRLSASATEPPGY